MSNHATLPPSYSIQNAAYSTKNEVPSQVPLRNKRKDCTRLGRIKQAYRSHCLALESEKRTNDTRGHCVTTGEHTLQRRDAEPRGVSIDRFKKVPFKKRTFAGEGFDTSRLVARSSLPQTSHHPLTQKMMNDQSLSEPIAKRTKTSGNIPGPQKRAAIGHPEIGTQGSNKIKCSPLTRSLFPELNNTNNPNKFFASTTAAKTKKVPDPLMANNLNDNKTRSQCESSCSTTLFAPNVVPNPLVITIDDSDEDEAKKLYPLTVERADELLPGSAKRHRGTSSRTMPLPLGFEGGEISHESYLAISPLDRNLKPAGTNGMESVQFQVANHVTVPTKSDEKSSREGTGTENKKEANEGTKNDQHNRVESVQRQNFEKFNPTTFLAFGNDDRDHDSVVLSDIGKLSKMIRTFDACAQKWREDILKFTNSIQKELEEIRKHKSNEQRWEEFKEKLEKDKASINSKHSCFVDHITSTFQSRIERRKAKQSEEISSQKMSCSARLEKAKQTSPLQKDRIDPRDLDMKEKIADTQVRALQDAVNYLSGSQEKEIGSFEAQLRGSLDEERQFQEEQLEEMRGRIETCDSHAEVVQQLFDNRRLGRSVPSSSYEIADGMVDVLQQDLQSLHRVIDRLRKLPK